MVHASHNKIYEYSSDFYLRRRNTYSKWPLTLITTNRVEGAWARFESRIYNDALRHKQQIGVFVIHHTDCAHVCVYY